MTGNRKSTGTNFSVSAFRISAFPLMPPPLPLKKVPVNRHSFNTARIVFVNIKSKFPAMNTTPTITLNLTGQLTINPKNLEQLSRCLQIQAPVQNPSTAQFGNGHEPRIYSREETAKMLGNKTPRYVDLLCRRGLLQKFIPKGNCRAIGVHSESLMAFIAQQRC
jgi:hypothetical protein